MTEVPERTALYRIRGEADLLYIGITKCVPVRWNGHSVKQPWWGELRSLTVDWYDSREEAEAAEEAAIRAERPKCNKRHKDGLPERPAKAVCQTHLRAMAGEIERLRKLLADYVATGDKRSDGGERRNE